MLSHRKSLLGDPQPPIGHSRSTPFFSSIALIITILCSGDYTFNICLPYCTFYKRKFSVGLTQMGMMMLAFLVPLSAPDIPQLVLPYPMKLLLISPLSRKEIKAKRLTVRPYNALGFASVTPI